MSLAKTWRLAGAHIDLTRGALMGVVNVTPDSFSDGGMYSDVDRAVEHALSLAAAGAAIVDVGGESTRPGAEPVPADLELERVIPVVSRLTAAGVLVSVDTYKPQVASACLEAGVHAINDITGFKDPGMVDLVAESGCGAIAAHMQGTPRTMSIDPDYDDVVAEVEDYLLNAADRLQRAGVELSKIAIDPGFGFGKRAHHSLTLLAATRRLAAHGLPLVLGTSRKGFLGADPDDPGAGDLLTAVTTALGHAWGARLFRVHDVTASKRALDLAVAIEQQSRSTGPADC